MRRFFHFLKKECGQAAVELALTLPLVLLLLCGLLELGWVAGNKLILENITREGVRAGIVATDSGSNTSLVAERISGMLPEHLAEGLTVVVTYSNASSFRSGDITVKTSYDLPAITPLSGMLTENGVFHLGAECTMKMS